jgi:hypothetical protein
MNRSMASFTILLTVAGCMSSPRNGQELTSYDVDFAGYVVGPKTFVMLKQWDWEQGEFIDLQQGTSASSSGTDDGSGTTWYQFSSSLPISNQSHYWQDAQSGDGQRRIQTKVMGFDTVAYVNLYTFDVNADDCFSAQSSGGDIIANCASSNTPAADLFLPCGKPGQTCCVAHDIDSSQLCDPGQLCSTESGLGGTCSTPAGGPDQPCNVNGDQCNQGLSCVDGTCRGTSLDRLPLITLDLQIRSCGDSSLIALNENSILTVGLGTGSDFIIETPAHELQAGQIDTFGLRIPGARTLGDIQSLDISLSNGEICIDELQLIANDHVVFDKTFDPTHHMVGQYPWYTDTLSISRDELRTFWSQLPAADICAAPEALSGGAFERVITGVLGAALRKIGPAPNVTDPGSNPDAGPPAGGLVRIQHAEFGDDGFVRATKRDDSSIHIDARFSALIKALGLESTVQMEIEFDLTPTCGSDPKVPGLSISFQMSPIWVTGLSGDATFTIVDLHSAGALEPIAKTVSEDVIADQTGSLTGALKHVVDNLIACPTFSIDDATPPDIVIGYPVPREAIPLCK